MINGCIFPVYFTHAVLNCALILMSLHVNGTEHICFITIREFLISCWKTKFYHKISKHGRRTLLFYHNVHIFTELILTTEHFKWSVIVCMRSVVVFRSSVVFGGVWWCSVVKRRTGIDLPLFLRFIYCILEMFRQCGIFFPNS
jgi:hypothetical protein